MSPLTQPRYSPEEYLALERKARRKSEYLHGRIYALAGASRVHNLIVFNFATALGTRLRGRPCEAYVSDMRVKVSQTGLYTYPDVVALCGEPRVEDPHVDTLLNPSVIIEVLSDSTEGYDRGEKFAHYRRLDSLREYVLVAQDKVRVELYVREGEHWVLSEVSDPEGTLELPSIGCAIPVRGIYERIEFPDAEAGIPGHGVPAP